MTKTELEQVIIEVVREIQQMGTGELVTIDATTRPINDLPEFDSLNGVEITVELMDRLKLELDFNNVLVEDDKALSISEAAARLLPLIPRG